MLRKIISLLLVSFVLTSPLSFAAVHDDTPCVKGDGNALCSPDMHLYAQSKSGLFCNENADGTPNTFRHSAVKGAIIMHTPMAWQGLHDRIKHSGAQASCGFVGSWCSHHDSRQNCSILYQNCINDDNYFIAHCK